MSSDFNFHCYILIPRKCPRKTLFQHSVRGGGSDPLNPRFRQLIEDESSCPQAQCCSSRLSALYNTHKPNTPILSDNECVIHNGISSIFNKFKD